MGSISVISEPKELTLSGLPNWIQLQGNGYSNEAEIAVEVKDGGGKHIVTLQKSLTGAIVWFDLNAVFRSYNRYNVLAESPGWFETGTSHTYQVVVSVTDAGVTEQVYKSDIMQVLQGWGASSEDNDRAGYQYNSGSFKLLSNKPATYYVRGQKEFLNFAAGVPRLSASPTSVTIPTAGGSVSVRIESNITWVIEGGSRAVRLSVQNGLRVAYEAYTNSGVYLGTYYGQDCPDYSACTVNTCLLNIDAVLDLYPGAGVVRVALAYGETVLSNKLEYLIRPTGLHKLRPVYFVNRLGGWDAFNFDAPVKEDISNEIDTYNRSLTPSYTKGDSLEAVARTTLKNTYTIEGAPISDAVAHWLKELAMSRIVLDGDGNYIIIEEFKLTVDPENCDMQIPTIKYRLSETYVNG